MIGPRDDSDGDASPEAASPWATGEIDAAPPAEIEWSTTPGPLTEEDAGPVAPRTPNRLGAVAGALAAAVVVLVAAVVLWPGDDGPRDEASDPDAAPTTLGTLPESNDDDEEVTTTRPGSDDDEDDPAPARTGGVLDVAGDRPIDLPRQLDLPDVLAAVEQPTEIVMSTERGLATLSLPSGNVRYSVVSDSATTGGSELVVSPEATAFITSPAGQLAIVPRDGLPVVVDELRPSSNTSETVGGFDGFYVRSWTVADDGKVYFEVLAYDSSGTSGEQLLLVDATGAVSADRTATSPTAYDFVRSSGRSIVNEGGGVFLIESDGSARRLAIGRAFAANGDFFLFRECDDDLTCRLVVANLDGERREVDPGIDIASFWSLDLAPDGGALATLGPSDEFGQSVRIVDLTTGSVTGEMSAAPTSFSAGSAWLADGSGVVQANPRDGGLMFLDRASGSSIEFGDEQIGRVFSIGLRYPETELPAARGPVTVSGLGGATKLGRGSGLNVVVLGPTGNMALVDFDEERATAWITPRIPNPQTPELFVVDDTVLALGRAGGFASGVGSADPIDTESVDIPLAPRVRGPGAGQVWVKREDATNEVDHVLVPVLTDPSGSEAPPAEGIFIPDVSLLGEDGLGGLVVDGAGGVFVATPTTRTRLTTGDLLALGRNHALVRECDEQLSCRTVLRERSTDVVSELTALDPLADPDGVTDGGGPVAISSDDDGPVAGTISPNGDIVLTRRSDESSWAYLDLATNKSGTIAAPADDQPLVWSDDGQTLVYVSVDGDLHVYDRSEGRFEIVAGLGSVDAIVAVPDEFVATATS